MWENVDNSVTIDTSAMRRMFAMYMFCADTYLAPIYSECFEDVDDLVTHIEEANTEEWGKKLLADQGCMFLKQYQHYFSDCAEGAGEGADGLVSYIHCARNTVWATHLSEEDLISLFADHDLDKGETSRCLRHCLLIPQGRLLDAHGWRHGDVDCRVSIRHWHIIDDNKTKL